MKWELGVKSLQNERLTRFVSRRLRRWLASEQPIQMLPGHIKTRIAQKIVID